MLTDGLNKRMEDILIKFVMIPSFGGLQALLEYKTRNQIGCT